MLILMMYIITVGLISARELLPMTEIGIHTGKLNYVITSTSMDAMWQMRPE